MPIDAVIQGETSTGGRANVAIENEYRIILPAPEGTVATLWDFQKRQWATRFTIPRNVVKTD